MKFLRFMLAFILAFALAIPASAMTGNSGQPAHYLALGDSLAIGVDDNNELSNGYAGELAAMLGEDGLLASYNKGFAYPGYKTADVLNDLANNVEKPIITTNESVDNPTGSVKIHDAIKQADIITLSIGANDILANVNVDKETGKLEFNVLSVSGAITTTGNNLSKILQEIHKLNPTADVFVMGLYNPFPTLTAYAGNINMMVERADAKFEAVTKANNYYFIPVKNTMAENSSQYLPNPANIHPSIEGYKAIAQQFYEPVKEYIGLIPLPEVIDPEPLPTFKDIKSEDTAKYAGLAAQYGIMKGLPDGSFNPNGYLTRMQVTSMVVRLLDLKETKKVPYSDTSKLAAETQAELAKAYAAGLVPNEKTFKPREQISRLEVAKMIDAAYTYMNDGKKYRPTTIAPFTDIAKLKNEEKQIVTLLYDFKISTGSNGKFMPTSTVKRSQVAKMFVELKETIER